VLIRPDHRPPRHQPRRSHRRRHQRPPRQDRSPQRIGLVFLEAQPEQEQVYRCTGFTDATTKIWASIR